ncbi:MAG: metal-dependent hydrolase, partial [Flavobacteriaceae bacterium]|nr:metal-dependent hydrolase [Flavobacteriaceae bacterium]
LVSRWEKGVGWRQWSWFWFMCLVTHPLLDAHTTWGTQFFWPLEYRLAYKNIFVIDPLYTLPFLICLIATMRYKHDNPKRRTWNYRGLIISSGYLMLTLLLKGLAYTQFTDALEEQQITYQAIETKPTPLNSIVWTAHVETNNAYLIANYSFFDSKPIRFYSHPKNHEALGVLSSNDKVERLKDISEGWYVIRKEDDELFFNDLRFGQLSLDPSNTDYVFSYRLETIGDELAVVENRKRPENASQLLSELWDRMWGN